MKRKWFLVLITGLILFAAGCSGQEAETPEVVEPEAVVEPAALPMAEPAVEPEAAPEPATEPETAPEAVPEPAAVVAAATRIEVAATKEGITRVGDAKCKVCHKIQHASWSKSSHAALDPVLDCESCHGPGSEYKKMSIMKNRELAVAAGLVFPEAGFCTASCHTDDWNDGMLAESHERKPAA